MSLNLTNSNLTSTGTVKYDSQHRVTEIDTEYFQNGALVKTHHDVVTYGYGMRFDNWTDNIISTHQIIHGSSQCIFP